MDKTNFKNTKIKTRQMFNKAKPYKWVEIKGKKIRVEIVEEVPKGYVFLTTYQDFALFVLKTMFTNDDNYVLISKKNLNDNKEEKNISNKV